MTKIQLFLLLADPNEFGVSRKIFATEFINEFKFLRSGNGYKWPEQLKGKYLFERGGSGDNWFIKLNGIDNNHIGTRQIRNDIFTKIKSLRCEHTGFAGISSDDIEVDHRNGRYDDLNVLNLESQNFNDFIPLTRRSNMLKRSSGCVPCKKTNKRFDATQLGFSIGFIRGDVNYDESLGCDGCYWYSPIDFKKSLVINKND